ncbi:MAG TPA: carboxypeptidase-like regulatory domain-containing protein [Thermoanaerobaculia bacterium]|jgi:hypothetical protein
MEHSRRILLVLTTTCILAGVLSCKKTEITGAVHDAQGKPVSDARVSIPNSAYQAQTNEGGRYTIPFAPGTFEVRVEKAGYVTQSLQLSLTTAAPFQAETVVIRKLLAADDAKRQLESIFASGSRYEYIHTGEYSPYSGVTQYVRVRSGLVRQEAAKAAALADAGFVSFETIASRVPTPFRGEVDHIAITPTEKLMPFLAGAFSGPSSACNDPCMKVVTATPRINIRHIAEPAAVAGRPTSVVSYQLDWVNTPIGDIFGYRSGASEKTANFVLDADGWQLAAP